LAASFALDFLCDCYSASQFEARKAEIYRKVVELSGREWLNLHQMLLQRMAYLAIMPVPNLVSCLQPRASAPAPKSPSAQPVDRKQGKFTVMACDIMKTARVLSAGYAQGVGYGFLTRL
jgi:hypothetical protein